MSNKALIERLRDIEQDEVKSTTDLARAAADALDAMEWKPERFALKNTVVIVDGGLAMKRDDDVWYSGMEEPLYARPIEWDVKVFMPLPSPPEEE